MGVAVYLKCTFCLTLCVRVLLACITEGYILLGALNTKHFTAIPIDGSLLLENDVASKWKKNRLC